MNATPLSVRFAFLAALSAGLLAATLLLLAAFLRVVLVRRSARSGRTLERWRLILLQGTMRRGLLPYIPRQDRPAVMMLWNHLYESVRGPLRDELRDVAPRAGIDKIALKTLRRGRRTARLLAIVTVGNLGLRDAWELLVPMVRAHNPTLSLAAARALLRIDPSAATPVVAPAMADRDDWHAARVAPVVAEAPEDLAVSLAARLPTAHPSDQARLVRLLEATRNRSVLPAIRQVLAVTTDRDVVAACLRALAEFRDPRDAATVRRFLAHEASFVRVQAVAALGKLGARADEPRLVGMLGDTEWWVRYRAAQSLVSMPFLSPEHLRSVAASQSDRYARDALKQALAEAGAR